MEKILCPSMMCANYGHLADEVRALDDAEPISSTATSWTAASFLILRWALWM